MQNYETRITNKVQKDYFIIIKKIRNNKILQFPVVSDSECTGIELVSLSGLPWREAQIGCLSVFYRWHPKINFCFLIDIIGDSISKFSFADCLLTLPTSTSRFSIPNEYIFCLTAEKSSNLFLFELMSTWKQKHNLETLKFLVSL